MKKVNVVLDLHQASIVLELLDQVLQNNHTIAHIGTSSAANAIEKAIKEATE